MTDNVEPLNIKSPEDPGPARITVNYPSPIYPDFDQAGMPCPVCATRAPLPTVRQPIPHVKPIDGQTPCMQIHKSCWELITVMKAHETAMSNKNGKDLILPPAKKLILPPGM
jgi:hypothetical protein